MNSARPPHEKPRRANRRGRRRRHIPTRQTTLSVLRCRLPAQVGVVVRVLALQRAIGVNTFEPSAQPRDPQPVTEGNQMPRLC